MTTKYLWMDENALYRVTGFQNPSKDLQDHQFNSQGLSLSFSATQLLRLQLIKPFIPSPHSFLYVTPAVFQLDRRT